MKLSSHILFGAAICSLAACGGNAGQPDAEDRVENAAEQSAAAAGTTEAALGMTELQLLDAELIDSAGMDLGDVESVSRDASGQVDRLLVEVEDSNPDRYVYVPIAGLTATQRGDDMDITTTMTRADFDALPSVDLSAVAPAAQ